MFINRMPVYIAFGLFLITMYGLFQIKDQVMMLRFELKEVKRQMTLERDSIHILKAELSYLSSPERLSRLNDNYLKLNTTTTEQIVNDPIHDDANKASIRTAANNINIKAVKWRFKKGPAKYVTQVAGKR